MIIMENELNDIGLNHNLMVKRFNSGKPIYISHGRYVITNISLNKCLPSAYKLIRVKENKK